MCSSSGSSSTEWPVIKAWGFTYKTSLVWEKVEHNDSSYVSVRHDQAAPVSELVEAASAGT